MNKIIHLKHCLEKDNQSIEGMTHGRPYVEIHEYVAENGKVKKLPNIKVQLFQFLTNFLGERRIFSTTNQSFKNGRVLTYHLKMQFEDDYQELDVVSDLQVLQENYQGYISRQPNARVHYSAISGGDRYIHTDLFCLRTESPL